MSNETIKCPKCGFLIPVSEVLTHQIKETLSAELEKDRKKREAQLIEKAEQKALESVKVEIKDLKVQLAEKDKKLSESETAELTLRAKTRELENQKKSLELEVSRRIDAEREKITQEALKKADESHRFKDMEKDKKIQDLMKSLDEAKRKAEQGSTQIQGEVLELSIEDILKRAFPADDIKPVPKGIKGADVTHKVHGKGGRLCGTIVWESKRTKAWNDDWIQKLKDDQREIGAEMAVIVSESMPKGIDGFGILNGVWITQYDLVAALALALRQTLIEVEFVKASSVGKNEKMEAVYQYLSGTEFRQKIEALVETFVSMKAQLDSEKRAMEKIWKEREKHVERIVKNTVGMYGEIRGVIGASSLPEIKALELGPISEDTPDSSK